MAVRIQFRRGTAAEWAAANPTLAAGELGYEVDTAQIKIGDGSSDWDNLAYAAVSASYIDNAIANVVGLSPESLDTLNELAAAINDDPNVFNTLSNAISTAESNALAYADTVESNAASYTDTAITTLAGVAQANAAAYTDNAVANLVSSAPAALDTLNELAAALGNDNNFATTISTSLGTKLAFISDTNTNFMSANAVTEVNTVYMLLGQPGYIKIGDGVTAYGNLSFMGEVVADEIVGQHNLETQNVHGISNVADLVYQSDLTTAITDVENDFQNNISEVNNAISATDNTINSISSSVTAIDGSVTAIDGRVVALETTSNTQANALTDLDSSVNTLNGRANTLENTVSTLATLDQPVLTGPTLTNALFTGASTLDENATLGGANAIEFSYLSGVTSAIQTQFANIQTQVTNQASDINLKAPINNPSFTGNVILSATTTIGDVSGVEIAYLDNVSSNIQSQLDAKLATASAASIYAPLSGATFTGNVVLTANTSIGTVSSEEIGFLNDVTSNIQTQLNAKAPTANPTFTGTVSGVTKGHVGLGNVDNTSDVDKPISNAVQTALDAKLALAGGTMTGKITLDGDPTQALHAVTKQYADSISEGLHIHASVVALSDSNIDLTGAAPTTVIDGVTLADGDRVIINGQTLPEQNGIYVYTLTGSVFNRAADFDEPGEVSGGDFVFVTGGTDYENTGWVKTSESVAVIGTDAINFTQFSGAGTVTAGSNIDVTGTQVSVIAAPTFTDKVTLSANGVQFADNTIQTSAGVPSLTSFSEKTASYTLDTLDHQDNVVEMNSASAITFTIPDNATLPWPVGGSMDIFQTGEGQVTIANAAGVTLNSTPGKKLRTQFSSCTIMKRGTDSWILYGDLTA